MLTQIVLPLKTLPTNFAAERQLWALMCAFMYHQVVGFGEAALAVLAHELAFWTQLAPEVPCVIFVDLHHSEHFV